MGDLMVEGEADGDGDDGHGSVRFPIPGVAAQMPEDLASAVRKGAAEFGGIESTDRTKRFRKVQVDLILGELDSLVEALKRWIVPGGTTEEAQDCPPGLMRFSAHLALLLWGMDLVKIVDDNGSLLRDGTNDGLQKLVWIYVIHLIDSASYELVPTYVVHLRKGLRRTTMQLLLEEATYNERIEVRKNVSARCDQWLDNYIGVEGIESGEMWASTQFFCYKSMRSSFGGPLTRAESVSWMFFDGKNVREATAAAVTLCRDFALSAVRGALAGLHLLREVIPPSLDSEKDEVSVLQSLSPELVAWETYFEVVREVAVWQEVFSDAVACLEANPNDPACDEALMGLAPDTQSLFEGIIKFAEDGAAWIEVDDATDRTNGGVPMEAVLIVGPSSAATDDMADGSNYDASTYPVYSDQVLPDACVAIEAVCKAVASSSSSLLYAVGPACEVAPAGCDLPGFVAVKVWAPRSDVDREAFEAASVSVFCGVLKSEALDVVASNIISTSSVSAAVCKAIIAPALMIHIARLREALSFIGAEVNAQALIEAEELIAAAKAGEHYVSQEEVHLLCELTDT